MRYTYKYVFYCAMCHSALSTGKPNLYIRSGAIIRETCEFLFPDSPERQAIVGKSFRGNKQAKQYDNDKDDNHDIDIPVQYLSLTG